MNRFAIFMGLLAVAGCAEVTDGATGTVKSYDGNTVVIRAPFAAGANARPTVAMTQLARDLCNDARFISASSSLYTFSCR